MPNTSSRKGSLRSVVMLLAILAVGAELWAQAPVTPGEQYPFGQWHVALSRAADSLLAGSVQRPAEAGLRNPSANEEPVTVDEQSRVPHTAPRTQAWRRVALLRSLIDPILRDEGVPTELSAVVLIESGGQITALSPKGARGIWQFMPDTARRYGLVVDSGKDERLDVLKSTRAAARYLRDLYERFRDWPLALAAYNAGEDAVSRAVDKTGRDDFAYVSYSLPLETRNYVPAVLAAMRRVSASGPVQLVARGTGHVLYASADFD